MATNSCVSPLQRSLAWCEGTPEMPGIKRRIYYNSKQNIVSWPSLSHDNIGRLQSASYAGKFVLAADTHWKFIDILPDKSQLTSEPQGEYPSMTQLNKLTAVHAGVGEEASALSAYVNNNDCVFLVETVRGKFRVVGSKKWQVKSTVAQDLGQGATGTTSTTLSVEATDECPAPFYTGEIDTEDGVFYPENGTLPSGDLQGDLNGDGVVDTTDVSILIDILMGITGQTAETIQNKYNELKTTYSGAELAAAFAAQIATWQEAAAAEQSGEGG